jgi:hypothetical protein
MRSLPPYFAGRKSARLCYSHLAREISLFCNTNSIRVVPQTYEHSNDVLEAEEMVRGHMTKTRSPSYTVRESWIERDLACAIVWKLIVHNINQFHVSTARHEVYTHPVRRILVS